jgi:hypothetical protein
VTSSSFPRWGALARIALALLAPAWLMSCGSGGVSGPAPVNDPGRITILPETAVLYSGLPTTFAISGGTGSYIVSSSNQAIVPAPGAARSTFTVVPANVVVDTPVSLTVRDTGTAPVVNASLTVRPGTVGNDITITPTATQGGSCAPAVCSGGDAIVSTTISQGGSPLPARGVRLDVVSGEFRFIVSPPGGTELLAATTTEVTDQAGAVHARIRVLPGAANQSAVLQVTDIGTSAFRRATFTIAQATGTSPGFFTVPGTFTFTGPNNLSCAQGARADVSVFGGTAPYSIGNGGSAFSVNQNVVLTSGGSFAVIANGVCAENIPIAIMDAAGRTTSVIVSNLLGENTVPDLIVSPTSVTLASCLASATVTVAGGIPNSFTVSNTSGAVIASPNPSARVISIARSAGVPATTPVLVGVASGDKVATITVNLAGEALTTRCDGSNLNVQPQTVTLAGCGFADVVVSGGTPPYFAVDNTSTTTSSMVGTNIVKIQRVSGSPALTDPGTVTVFDSTNSVPRVSRAVTVNVTGSCP